MRILSHSEAEDLLEHLQSRPDIWLLHKDTWIRVLREKVPEPYGLALQLRNGYADGEFHTLTVKPLLWTEDATQSYIEWLLDKYTSYSARMRIVLLLRPVLRNTADIHIVSRDVCNVQGGPFISRRTKNNG